MLINFFFFLSSYFIDGKVEIQLVVSVFYNRKSNKCYFQIRKLLSKIFYF